MPPVPYMEGGPGSHDPTRVVFHNYALRELLTTAYAIKESQLSGPAWLVKSGYLDADRFEINATLPAGTTKEQFLLMLQNLLVDRFHLKLHRTEEEGPVYGLVIGKNGPKLKESVDLAEASEPQDPTKILESLGPIGKDGFFAMAPGHAGMQVSVRGDRTLIKFVSYSMLKFADWLFGQLRSPVLDRTGIEGVYDFGLEYQDTLRAAPVAPEGEASSGNQDGPDIFGAVQSQLGLNLVHRRGPIEVLVVDRADRMPTAN